MLLQKTLSIPATVSGVVKYIPELQEQVEGLIQKKEELLSRISRQEQQTRQENPRQLPAQSSSSAVAASWLNDREVMIQISTYKSPLSEILLNLEQDGFQLLNASAFESFGGRVFHNLHLQVCFVSFVCLFCTCVVLRRDLCTIFVHCFCVNNTSLICSYLTWSIQIEINIELIENKSYICLTYILINLMHAFIFYTTNYF